MTALARGTTIARVNAFPGLAAAGGGALVTLGALLAWIRFSFSEPALRFLVDSISGTSTTAGKVALVCGILLLGFAAAMVAGGARLRRSASVGVVVLGIGAAAAAVTSLASGSARADDAIRGVVARAVGHALSQAQLATLEGSLRAAGLAVTPGAGVFVVLAGGLLAAAGGLTGLALRGGEPLAQTLGFARRETEPPFPPAPEPGPMPAPEPGPAPAPEPGPGPPVADSGEV